MGFLDRWLDEPDESIARFAKAFYVLTYVFLAVFAWQLYLLLQLRVAGSVRGGDVAAPLLSLFLTALFYALALDGRRSYKTLKAKQA